MNMKSLDPAKALWEAITKGMTPEEKKRASIRLQICTFANREKRKELRKIHNRIEAQNVPSRPHTDVRFEEC